MILLLHGSASSPSDVDGAARAYVSACFRVIALKWEAVGASLTCLDVPDAALDTQHWNQCLILDRWSRLFNRTGRGGVSIRLQNALEWLQIQHAGDGWSSYLKPNGFPDWSKIIVAGHSEGAGMTSFMLRQLPIPGAIFMSGGGDPGTLQDALVQVPGSALSMADWMTPVPESSRHVGIWHMDEDHHADFPAGFTRNGVSVGNRVDVSPQLPGQPWYQSFVGTSRLRRSDDRQNPHGSTKDGDIFHAHMYLACRAGGRTTAGFQIP